MFLIHQIVNVVINPIFIILTLLMFSGVFRRKGFIHLSRWLMGCSIALLFLLSWPPVVDVLGAWLERDYPAMEAESYPDVDAVIVLGGGLGLAPKDVKYPYPMMTDAADRVWHGARIWHAQRKRHPGREIGIFCTGPDVSSSTPPLLIDMGVESDAIFTFDDPLNTEAEAKLYGEKLAGKTVLLVTSAMHMKRSMMIFRKYAPGIKVIPAATDHHFLSTSQKFLHWQYYCPNLGTLDMASAIEHELVGIKRYAW